MWALGCSHEASTTNHADGAGAGSASGGTTSHESTANGGTTSRESTASGGTTSHESTANGGTTSRESTACGGGSALSSGGTISADGGATQVTAGATFTDSSSSSVTYRDDANAIFANPERGFYHHEGSHAASHEPLDLQTLIAYRNQEAISLVLRIFYLEPFTASDISAAHLSAIRSDLETIRAAGLKTILRFAYTEKDTPPYGDVAPNRVLGHIAQLTPILQQNADIILTVQAGFIGAWGEWYYTDFFGDQGEISATQWADRRAVVDALLTALPPSRGIQLRTPAFKQHFFGANALSATEAFTDQSQARVGHHNDCFVASSDDYGTYNDTTADKAYLAAENLYVLQGGETCAVSSYSTFDNAAAEMQRLHYTFLNRDYNEDVLNSWGAKIDTVRRSLGYRLTLQSGTYANAGHRGGRLPVMLVLQNAGYAPPIGPRSLELLLRNVTDHSVYRATLSADPRRFTPGAAHTVSATLCVPNDMPGGSYELLLHLADPSAALHDLPAYTIRLSNTELWDSTTGYHTLNHRITINEELDASGCGSNSTPLELLPSR